MPANAEDIIAPVAAIDVVTPTPMPANAEDIIEPVAAIDVVTPTPIEQVLVPPAGHPSGAGNALGRTAANA
eukprot:15359776-Heterocapsa_arctica.AAC.1